MSCGIASLHDFKQNILIECSSPPLSGWHINTRGTQQKHCNWNDSFEQPFYNIPRTYKRIVYHCIVIIIMQTTALNRCCLAVLGGDCCVG